MKDRYSAVVSEIRESYKNSVQITKTSFCVVTRENARSIREKLTAKIKGKKGEDGVILVVDISLCGWASHDLPESASDWLDKNV